ncbi:MAG TPA: hypothetical protein DDZ40_13900 [Deltaproteobacteria bacterium]|nr:hypothetical protein [Deltaproteobacteria bacterium]
MGECVYCGKKRLLTEDHIPPKCLFPKQGRNNLLRIPSCNECHGQNAQVSLDDEYFRNMLINRDGIQDNDPQREVRMAAVRAFEKPFKAGFRNAFLRTAKEIDVFTKGGIFLGKAVSYEVDLRRLNRVAERIIRGLFYHHKGYRLPDNCELTALETGAYQPKSKAEGLTVANSVYRVLANRELIEIEKGLFSYRFNFASDIPDASMWALKFYDRIVFFGMTLPPRPSTNEGGAKEKTT